MSLPDITPSHLQRVVMEAEFGKTIDFDALCKIVANGSWAKTKKLDAATVGQLILKHGTITKCSKPAAPAEPAAKPEPPTPKVPKRPKAPEPKAPKPDPAPEPKAPQPETPKAPGAKEIKVFDEGGRGRKQCPACKKFVGALSKTCVCGHVFVSKVKETPEPEPETEPREPRDPTYINPRHLRISTPAGKCPFQLKSTSHEDVEEWAEQVREHGERQGKFYTLRALIYWVRYTYEVNSSEYREARAMLKELYGGETVLG